MLLEKSRNSSFIAVAVTVALAVSSTIVLLGGCTSPTKAPVDNPEIVLLTPQGGETFHVGDSLKVTWKLEGNGSKDIVAVDIELSPDNGKTWGLFLSVNSILPNTALWQNFSWKIPSTFDSLGTTINLANDSLYLLRVEQHGTHDPNLMSVMKTSFTILPSVDNAEIVLLTPKGGETFHVGDSLKVTWKLQGNGSIDIVAVDVELSPDNGKTWGPLMVSSIYPTDAQWANFSWVIPGTINFFGTTYTLTNNSQCLLHVMQYSTNDTNLISVTKTPFTILP